MLKYFSIKNFGPFKNFTEWHNDILNPKNKEYYDYGVASMSMLFGKNLSGKSAFIEAIKFIRELLGGNGVISYKYSDYYYNGPKNGVQDRTENTEFVIEFVTHEKLYRYEISLNLVGREIQSEHLLYKPVDNFKKKFKQIYSRVNYTDVTISVDFGEFGHLLEKYFNDIDESLLHRIAIVSGAMEIEEFAEPYNYMRNTLKFVDDDHFIITETGLNLEEVIIEDLMDKLEELEAPVDGYYLVDCTDIRFIDRNENNDANEIRRLMDYYESDSVNIAVINKNGIFFISNAKENVYRCVQLKLSKNGIPVDSKGIRTLVKLCLMLNFNDDATYIYDDFGNSIDERYIAKFFEMWKTTAHYKQIIAATHNTNFMANLDRADINLIIQNKNISSVVNPAKDLKWRNDRDLERAYLEL